jgi:hypothetical protein
MPPVGFEHTISLLERAKTVRALDLRSFKEEEEEEEEKHINRTPCGGG